MGMTHLSESEFVRAADASMTREERAAFDAHLASCPSCRETLEAQMIARRALAARPIAPARDLSAAVRASLEAERPWIERLNWRRLSLRVAPIAAALTIVALLLVRTADTTAVAADSSATDHTVASALWSGEVTDDQLLSLFLQARPDDALSTYVKEK
ncbi:MAG: hypothetical protein EPO35_00945 [Acidobacteria bacterium]|nr:MAG: hypothetical protein EPO35_00945 [Acidobacteriota bacterium]